VTLNNKMSNEFDAILLDLTTGSIDASIFDIVSDSLLLKYYLLLDIQFKVFEEMGEKTIDLNCEIKGWVNVEDGWTDCKEFNNNENDYLRVARTVKMLYPIREKLLETMKKRFSYEEFDRLLEITITDYDNYLNR
jgi:hypothetical protein